MKKIAFLALAASAAAIAMPAAALDTVGTIIINGSVEAKCSVVPTNAGNTWGGTVNMGELAQADGTLKASSTLSTTFATVNAAALTAKIVCNSADPTITVDADPLESNTTTTDAGYTNRVDFQADVTVTTVAGDQPYANDTNGAATGPTALGARLDTSGNNVSVATSNWRTLTSGDILIAANDYSGQIVVTIAPTVVP